MDGDGAGAVGRGTMRWWRRVGDLDPKEFSRKGLDF